MNIIIRGFLLLFLMYSSKTILCQNWSILPEDDQLYYVVASTVYQIHPTYGEHLHEGIDIDCSNFGVNIKPISDGVILDFDDSNITIGHNYASGIPQRISTYRHFNSIDENLDIGDYVSSSVTTLGEAGNHLHLEMRVRIGNNLLLINPLSNNTGWQLTLPPGHADTYLPQINDILIEPLNNQPNNVPSGFDAENLIGAVPFHNTYLKAHFSNTQFSNLSAGSEYIYPDEKIVVWGNLGFIVNARDVGVNTQPTTFSGEGLTVSALSYSYVSPNGTEFEKYKIDFSEFLDAESYQLDQLFRIPYFNPEQMPNHYLYGNHDFIELRSTDNAYLHVHQQINGIQSNGIWFTKADVNTPHVFNQTPTQIAAANEFAKCSDGEQTLRFHAEDAADQETNEDLHLIVDNFLPFIKEVSICRAQNPDVPEYERGWYWQGGTYVLEQEPVCNFVSDDNIEIHITTSEPMLYVDLDLNDFSHHNLSSSNTQATEWIFIVSSTHVNSGVNQLEINGQDYAENYISTNPAILYSHQQNGQWLPLPNTGSDMHHSFSAGQQSEPPTADFEADIKYPVQGQTVTFTSTTQSLNPQYSWTFSGSPNLSVHYEMGYNDESQNPQVHFY
ncbi:MAG: hypothetical protein PHX39_02065 [Bacteroidales bacterium]|jgi:hypothetical protein|nr:hypothetical protein [Bacteroidales bacterium]